MATYFTVPTEPVITAPILSTVCIAIIALSKYVPKFIRTIFTFLFGFVYAAMFTHLINTPILQYDLRDYETDAIVQDIDYTSDKTRIIAQIDIDGTPTKVRLNLPQGVQNISIGDKAHIIANIFPPSSQEAPDTFDYSRWAYFNHLSATGFISEYNTISTNTKNNIRTNLHNTTNSKLVDALVLGYKNALSESEKQTWTNAGIAHIWSISGFHMTLVGGWLFIIFYSIFRCVGYITKRIPARIPATICAWIGLGSYLAISGFGVATLRAFLMASLMFTAILFGRNAISLRNVCLAFLAIILFNPYFVVHAGFQLSFAAIFGIIWYWNRDNKSAFIQDEEHNKILHGIYVATLTTIIATLFTLPFIMAHFNSVPLYSLLGNLILVPIFSFVIMPIVMIGTILSMFGFNILLDFTNTVYLYSLSIAEYISNLPHATITMPHISSNALSIIVFGLFSLIFIIPDKKSKTWVLRNINYLIASIFIFIGISIVIITPKPVFFITPDHELIGMVYNGKLEFNKARASNHYFAFNTFRQLNTEAPSDKNIRRKCPDGLCLYKSDKFTIVYIQKFVPLQKHFNSLCRDNSIDYIVSYFDIQSPICPNKLLKNGFVIYKSGKIKYTQTNRLWHKMP